MASGFAEDHDNTEVNDALKMLKVCFLTIGLFKRCSSNVEMGLLLCLLVASALVETLTIASTVPFLYFLVDSGGSAVAKFNSVLSGFFDLSSVRPLNVVASIFVLLFCLSTLLKIYVQWKMNDVTEFVCHRLRQEILCRHLMLPYEELSRYSPSYFSSIILGEVDHAVNSALRPLLTACYFAVVALSLFGFLIFVDWFNALIILLLFSILYLLIYYGFRMPLRSLGDEKVRLTKEKHKLIANIFNGLKTVKFFSVEQILSEKFRATSAIFAKIKSRFFLLEILPRFMLECIFLLGIVTYILVSNVGEEITSAIPVIGLYIFVGYRLLPACQQIFSSLSALRFSTSSVEAVEKALKPIESAEESLQGDEFDTFRFQKQISVSDLGYTYPDGTVVLKNISFEIRRGEFVGIVGSSGSGKTTILDLLVGLLSAKIGEICIDGVKLDPSTSRAWRRSIGYVPQEVYLLDESIEKNLTLSFNKLSVDRDKLAVALDVAAISDFFELQAARSLGDDHQGSGRMSGGQKQRLSIARALYRQPRLLVMDEGTSALDAFTERSIINGLKNLPYEPTLLISSHRVESLKSCDRILVFNDGDLVGYAPFDELIASSDYFASLVIEGNYGS